MLSSREVAERLGVSQATVLRAVINGVLKPFATTPGGHHRFREEDIASIAGAPPPELRGSGARLVSSSEAARILGVSHPTVLRAVRDGRLRPDETTPGGHYRFSDQRLAAMSRSVEGGVLGTGEAARFLGISEAEVLKQVEEGSLRPAWVTPGGHNRFDATTLGPSPPSGPGPRARWMRLVGRLRLGPGMRNLPLPPGSGNGGNGNGHSGGHGNGHPNGNGNGSNGNSREQDPLRRLGIVAGGGLLVVAAGVASLEFGWFEHPLREAIGALAIAVGGLLVLAEMRVLRSRPDHSQLTWAAGLNALLLLGGVMAAVPIGVAVWGFVDLVRTSEIKSGSDLIAYGLAFSGLVLGAMFFTYAIKYYLSTGIVLLTTLAAPVAANGNGHSDGSGNGGNRNRHPSGLSRLVRRGLGAKTNGNGKGHNGNGKGHNGNGNGNGHNGFHVDLGYHPFISVHIAAYNEKRVIERLLSACEHFEYPEFEVILVDDSTDAESIEILSRWKDKPRFKIIHRKNRQGYKGGALKEALRAMDRRAEYVVIFDADSMPFPDALDRFLPHFYYANGNGKNGNGHGNGHGNGGQSGVTSGPAEEKPVPKRREEVAAVQSYQWHVLNKSESWLTEAVRAEYSGSYMVERPFQDAVGSLKMIAGTAYMIRAELLRMVGWGTSLTEDWELTLKLYARGYKVLYTPWAETPAECVSTFSRLARQRMRWAEGHTHNVRNWFWPILLSPFVTPVEKLEFLFDATYYLQAALFIAGSGSWAIAEIFFHAHVPGWTALLGWSLLFSNVFALPLMNLGGLILEEAPNRDLQGVLGAIVLSYALVPFQAWAALKGLLRKEEGPWFRTPKTGHITDPVKHLRRLNLLRQWLRGPRAKGGGRSRRPSSPPAHFRGGRFSRRVGWVAAGSMAVALMGVGFGAMHAPVAQANSGSTFNLHAGLIFDTAADGSVLQAIVFSSVCVPACPVVFTAAVAGTTTATTNAQTIFAGTYSWQYWSDVVGANATITWTFEYGDNVGCTTNPVTIASFAGVPLNINQTGTTATVGTSGANVAVPAGKFFCLSLAWASGGPATLHYDKKSGVATALTNFTTPQVIFIPEYGLALLGIALVSPVAATAWTRRRNRHSKWAKPQ